MKIQIINGPNLNLLGKREPEVYGKKSFDEYFQVLTEAFAQHEIIYFQSNSEGAIIDKIHEVGFDVDGIVLNAGAYTHTSLAIADAISAVSCPVIEVHISNVHAREAYRQHSYLAKNCLGVISGFGLESYRLAIQGLELN
ncbi:type II 3-dehydroquinate dehydratase [Albibacterium profundi]|uniref:3-dehydroquinate dehydratase n=1 Tax=Albibacterium profundi TaxID=3134906 RepID=A0ABV5CBM6_9SPHI